MLAKKLKHTKDKNNFMKRLFVIAALFLFFGACNPNTNQGGAVDDGIKSVDSNGAFDESAPNENQLQPGVDTAKGEDRVDIQSRDSANISQ